MIELDRGLVGLTLHQTPAAASQRSGLCTICVTQHSGSGLALPAAPRPGAAGRQGNTAGTYMCADLACSLYVRGKRTPTTQRRMAETISVPERVERARRNAERFVTKVIDGGHDADGWMIEILSKVGDGFYAVAANIRQWSPQW